jgi:hypothetical protein
MNGVMFGVIALVATGWCGGGRPWTKPGQVCVKSWEPLQKPWKT